MNRLLLLALVVMLAGCRGERGMPAIFGAPEIEPANAIALDSLAAHGAHVSISGTVMEQRATEVLVEDGTGLIIVDLPEEPPLLSGMRLAASGQLIDDNGTPRLQATEWLYDSTAVPVHSD